MEVEVFAEDMEKGRNFNIVWNARQRLPEYLLFGIPQNITVDFLYYSWNETGMPRATVTMS